MRTAGPGRESFSSVHSPAGRDVVVDGSDSAGRHRRLSAIAGFGAAGGRLPDDPGADVLSRSESGCHGSAVTAPLETAVRQVPGLNQMTSTSSDGSSVITLQFSLNLNIDVAEQEVQAAINAAQTFLPRDLPSPPIYSKTNPADAPILTLALTSKTMPLSKVRGPGGYTPGSEDLAVARCRTGEHQRWPEARCSHSGQSHRARRPTASTLEDVRTALQQTSVNQAKGNFDGPHQSYQIGANDQLLSSSGLRAADRRLSQRRAGHAVGCGNGDRRRRERAARPRG